MDTWQDDWMKKRAEMGLDGWRTGPPPDWRLVARVLMAGETEWRPIKRGTLRVSWLESPGDLRYFWEDLDGKTQECEIGKLTPRFD